MTVDTNDVAVRIARAVQHIRFGLAELGRLERQAPGEVGRIAGLLVAHLRSWRPEAVAPLGTLPAPTEPIRDPRTAP
jgi:hypothetical protein